MCVAFPTERADQAKRRAEGTLGVAERVVEALEEAANAQDAAESAIMNASDDIEATQIHLTQVGMFPLGPLRSSYWG